MLQTSDPDGIWLESTIRNTSGGSLALTTKAGQSTAQYLASPPNETNT